MEEKESKFTNSAEGEEKNLEEAFKVIRKYEQEEWNLMEKYLFKLINKNKPELKWKRNIIAHRNVKDKGQFNILKELIEIK